MAVRILQRAGKIPRKTAPTISAERRLFHPFEVQMSSRIKTVPVTKDIGTGLQCLFLKSRKTTEPVIFLTGGEVKKEFYRNNTAPVTYNQAPGCSQEISQKHYGASYKFKSAVLSKNFLEKITAHLFILPAAGRMG